MLERFEEARAAARRARRAEALALLDGCESWPEPANEEALLVRAEVLARRDPVAGLEALAASHDLFHSAAGRFGYFLTSAYAYTNSRNFEGAREMLESARAFVEGDAERKARLAYFRARLLWPTRVYDPNADDFAIALRSTDPMVVFGTLSSRSWMHAGLENYEAQMRDLLAAMEVFRKDGSACDLHNVAISLHALLRLAVELGDDEAAKTGEAVYEAMEWSPDIAGLHFLCVRALAWHAYLQGEPGRAQWLFKDSKAIAPTDAWRVMAHVDRAFVARTNGNEAWAAEELALAGTLARSVQWSAADGDERQALVMLAELFAPIDMTQAQRYVSMYIQLGMESVNPNLAAAHERRFIAYEKYASGRVQAVLGNSALAQRHLEYAYEIFSQIQHAYRAALAASALHDLTGEQRWLERSRSQAAHFRRSAVYRKLYDEAAEPDVPALAGLTPMQRQILIAYCETANLEVISQRFSRSVFTIQKQLEHACAVIGIRSRHALRAELQRRGLV